MEFFSKTMNWLVIASTMAISLFISSCSSDEPFANSSNEHSIENTLVKNADGSESIVLQNGEVIVLEDTITHIITFDPSYLDNIGTEEEMSSRGILYTGYDRESKPKDYKKYLLKGLEKWGINPTTVYIGKFITYYKDLPVQKGFSLLPSNTKYANENSMGFNPPSLTTVGFHTTIPATWTGYETGVTQVFYVNCDISGIYWNKNVPCNPDKFIWYFRSIADE